MRAHTEGMHEMGKRFAVVIGVAAVGVMALGAQTGAQTPAPTPPPPTCNGLAATIVGTEGRDPAEGTKPYQPLTGTSGRDVIVALGGDDGVYGGAGNDVICGGPGKDLLDGGAGKDTLLGQAGSDLLNGDGGNRADAPGKDRCEGGKGHDFTVPWHSWPKGPPFPQPLPVVSKSRTTCEVEKSIEKPGFIPPGFH